MIQTVFQWSRNTISKSLSLDSKTSGLSNYYSKIKQQCLSMCGPWVCFCLINIFSFGWRFSSGLSLAHSQQRSQSLSAASRARFTDQR